MPRASLGVGAVVLTATGEGFCTGADLRAGRRPPAPKPEGAPTGSWATPHA